MPKLPSKSIALTLALIVAVITPNLFFEKVILFVNNAQFGITEPVFNLDLGYYIFQAPLINFSLYYMLAIFILLTIYTVIYYIVTFNIYFDGINGQTLKNNTFIKQLIFNVRVLIILIAGIIFVNTQNIVLDKFLELNNNTRTAIIGAGLIDSTLKLWGYRILSIVIIISVFLAIKYFKKENFKNVIKSLAIVPVYLVALFVLMIGYKTIFISSNELDKEKAYINTNINNTKTAYNLKIEEKELNNTGTITPEEAEKNNLVINNIPIVTEKNVLNNLRQTQTSTGYYTYNNAHTSYYENELIYMVAREINSKNTTYNSEANEYTHGYGTVLVSASKTDESGNIIYISKDFEYEKIKEPRIYYGTETNGIISISKDKEEFDYPKTATQNETNKYNGNGGISLNLLDKIAVGINERRFNLIFSDTDKILLNRNIIQRAKKIIPYLIYDENPYLAIGDNGKLYWVIDAYTVANEYPFSQKTKITYENYVREINYIRNSAKVIVDAYDGTTNFYITDKTDPIIMAYNNMYKNVFKDQNEIPTGIEKYFTYSEFLYNIQANMLTMYHDVAADVLYRGNDVWQVASYSNLTTNTASVQMTPTYTMLKTVDSKEGKLGLVLTYNMYGRESMNAYLSRNS